MDVMIKGKMNKGNDSCPYCDLRIEPATNGHKVCYYEKSPGMSRYDSMDSQRKEFVYEASDLAKAFAKYKEISDCILSYSNHEKEEKEDEDSY
jgi:hypothetical protein